MELKMLFLAFVLSFGTLSVLASILNASFKNHGSLHLADVDCPPEGVVFYPHPNCSMYYLCFNGNPIEQECPSGTYFNPEVSECDVPVNVPECEGGTRPPVSTTPVPTTIGTTIVTSLPNGTTIAPPSNVTILRNCGDTFDGEEGVIEYKLGEEYDYSELCAFTLRIHTRTGITFTLEEHGIEENSNVIGGIAIFTFSENGHIDTAHLGPPIPLNTTFVAGSLAVVVFNSASGFRYNHTGFRLSFKGVGEAFDLIDPWELYTNSELSDSLDYPTTSGPGYRSDLLALFVISANHRRVDDYNYQSLVLNITQSDLDISGGCNPPTGNQCLCDFLLVNSFIGGTSGLVEQERYCDPNSHTKMFETSGLYILFLRTSSSTYGSGFSLKWDIESED